MNRSATAIKLALLCSALAIVPGVARAEESAPADSVKPDNSKLEEIVVTARRASENLQKTPVAVTAVSAAALAIKQVAQLSDLTRAAPSFAAIGGGTGGSLIGQYSLRGQSQSNPGSSNDSPVGVYVDGVYYARPMTNNGAVLDMASVEVLRGPQGTLFGRNTTGGALNITTQDPVDRFEGSFKIGAGNYSEHLVEGIFNAPLTDEVAVRFAGQFEHHDGYTFNANTNKREGDADNYFARASLKWTPNALPLTLRITGDYTHYRDNGTPAKINGINPAGALGGLALGISSLPGDFYTTFSGITAAGSLVNSVLHFPAGFGASGASFLDVPENFVRASGVNGNLQVDLGGVTLKSITAYRTSRATNTWDLDGLPVNGLAFGSLYTDHQFSQEFQLSGKLASLDWITGVYYFHEGGLEQSDAWQFVSFSRDYTHFGSTSTGLFGQLNYYLTDKIRATGGIRYTWDKRTADLGGVFGGVKPDYSDALCGVGATFGTPAGANCAESRSGKFSYPAWLVSLDYQITPNVFTYLKTSGASEAGGVNFRFVPLTSQRQFKPEYVRDVEWGFKADLLDRRLRTNAALFYIWRGDVQSNVTAFVPGRGTTQFQINAGKAHQYGAEFEATAIPMQGLELTGSVSYLHSSYQAGTYLLLGVDHSSDPIPLAPELTWSLGATQQVPTKLGDLSLHADYSYIKSYYQYIDTVSAAALATGVVGGHGVLNARAAFTLAGNPKVEFSVWGRNLTRTHYYSSLFNGVYDALGVSTAAVGAPRTFGGAIAIKW